MDFPFNINAVLQDEITEIDSHLKHCRNHVNDRHGFRQLQSMLYEIIDKMGDASAKAQNLHGSITTGKKLEYSNHRLYIMKDTQSTSNHGMVIGYLKVGNKKLFVYDNCKMQHELEPLCVLDFYVHESRQRMGCGKKLFQYMLRNEGVPVQHLAIDRPSPKFLSFLSKHYCLKSSIPQVNNYVIFEGFFNSRSDLGNKQINSAARPPSGSRNRQRTPNGLQQNMYLPQIQNRNTLTEQVRNADYNWTVSGLSSQSQSHMGAGQQMYSRHGVSSLTNVNQYNTAPPRGYTPTADHVTSYSANNQSHDTARKAGYSRGSDAGTVSDFRPEQADFREQMFSKGNSPSHQTKAGNPFMVVGGQDESSSSYHINNRMTSSSPIVDPHYPKDSLPSQLAPIPPPVMHRPPSGQRKNVNANFEPPTLNRDGPPTSYQNFLNMHNTYQQRNGHLNIPIQSSTVPVGEQVPSAPGYITNNANQNTSWTVMGVLRDQRLTSPLASRYNNRLW